MSFSRETYAMLINKMKNEIKNIQTGNVTVEKGTTDAEYLTLIAQKGTENESKVTFSKEEYR